MSLELVSYEADGWGVGELWAADGRLVHHELPRAPGPPRASTRVQRIEEPVAGGIRDRVGTVTIESLAGRITSYFAGERMSFADVVLDLEWCTPFQRAVTEALRAVPYGETVTYGELAALAGHPNAQRAAGSFCARNRFPLFVPCHRVVAADGIGSYGSLGIAYKQRLLALEGVVAL